MTKNAFWNIIEEARKFAGTSEKVATDVAQHLRSLPPTEVLAFGRQIEERLDESYRNDLWAVAYIVNGGCSDDGFEYFRGWLITQGRDYFEAALAQPERAADRIEPGDDSNECEDILYIPFQIYEELTGQPVPAPEIRVPRELAGTPWTEDELESLYPELCQRYFS